MGGTVKRALMSYAIPSLKRIAREGIVAQWVCSSVGRAAISKVAGRGFESLRTRSLEKDVSNYKDDSAMNLNPKPAQPVRVPSNIVKRAYGYFEDVKAEFLK